jgi:hypothetical protein
VIKLGFCMVVFAPTVLGFSRGNFLFPEITFRNITLQEINKDSTLAVVKEFREYKRIFGLTDILDTVNHFYLSDIDNDHQNELIYYGLISAEEKWSIIWKIGHHDHYLFAELFGRITGISDSLYIATMGPGSRGSDFEYANLYRIVEDEIDFQQCVVIFKRVKNRNSVLLRSAGIADGVKIPDSLPIRKNIVLDKSGYNLRTQPIIDDTPDSTDRERYGVLRGNTIVELGKGTVASVTAMYTDTTGNVWWFLVLDNPLDANYNVYKDFKKDKQKICGWISSGELDYKEIR